MLNERKSIPFVRLSFFPVVFCGSRLFHAGIFFNYEAGEIQKLTKYWLRLFPKCLVGRQQRFLMV